MHGTLNGKKGASSVSPLQATPSPISSNRLVYIRRPIAPVSLDNELERADAQTVRNKWEPKKRELKSLIEAVKSGEAQFPGHWGNSDKAGIAKCLALLINYMIEENVLTLLGKKNEVKEAAYKNATGVFFREKRLVFWAAVTVFAALDSETPLRPEIGKAGTPINSNPTRTKTASYG